MSVPLGACKMRKHKEMRQKVPKTTRKVSVACIKSKKTLVFLPFGHTRHCHFVSFLASFCIFSGIFLRLFAYFLSLAFSHAGSIEMPIWVKKLSVSFEYMLEIALIMESLFMTMLRFIVSF